MDLLLLILLLAVAGVSAMFLFPASDRYVTFDRFMIASSVALVAACLIEKIGRKGRVENFSCPDDEDVEEEDTSELVSMSPVLYSSVFGRSPVVDSSWGRITIHPMGSSSVQIPDNLARNGIPIQNRSLHTPHADSIDLASSDEFTVAMAMRFPSFDYFDDSDITAYTLLEIPCSTPPGEGTPIPYIARMQITKNESVGISASVSDTNASADIDIDPEKTYVLLLNRNNASCHLKLMQLNVSPVTGDLVEPDTLFTLEPTVSGLSLSNQPIKINAEGGIAAHAYAFSVFNRSLSDSQETTLQSYWGQKLREATLPGYRTPGECPYGPDVCANQYCAGIQDWSRPELIVDSRSECKDAIDEFCKANPDHDSCYCWNSDDTRSENDDCKRWLAFVRRGQCKDLAELDEDDLEYLKTKYKSTFECCKGEAEDAKPKSGIVNYYKEDGSPSPAKNDEDGEDQTVGIRNYYKAPDLSGNAPPAEENEAGTATASVTRSSINNPYTAATSATSATPPPRRQNTISESGRLETLNNIQLHDRWSQFLPDNDNADVDISAGVDANPDAEPQPSGNGIMSWVRSLMSS